MGPDADGDAKLSFVERGNAETIAPEFGEGVDVASAGFGVAAVALFGESPVGDVSLSSGAGVPEEDSRSVDGAELTAGMSLGDEGAGISRRVVVSAR